MADSPTQRGSAVPAEHVGLAMASAGEISFVPAAASYLQVRGLVNKQCWNSSPHASRFPRAHDMGLCSLCSGLPFTGFPRLSPSWLQHIADDREFIVARFPSHNPLPDPIGFPYHENIGALAESAKACPLCAVVHAGVQAWLVSWHKAAGTNELVEYLSFSGTLPLEERLWLTEIAPENQGFRVWAMNPWSRPSTERRQSLYLLTLVGFSVEERTFTPPISLAYQLHVWLMATWCFQTVH